MNIVTVLNCQFLKLICVNELRIHWEQCKVIKIGIFFPRKYWRCALFRWFESQRIRPRKLKHIGSPHLYIFFLCVWAYQTCKVPILFAVLVIRTRVKDFHCWGGKKEEKERKNGCLYVRVFVFVEKADKKVQAVKCICW